VKKTNLYHAMTLTAAVFMIGTSVCLAETGKKNNATALKSPVKAGWELVFSDTFDREELGENWSVVDGKWDIVDGCLRGSGTLISKQGFLGGERKGWQRLEFEAMTDVKPFLFFPGQTPEVTVGDISSCLHAQSAEETGQSPIRTGYFFQFGGSNNTVNKIVKPSGVLEQSNDPDKLIAQDKWHKIVAENDEGTLRLIVDGELVLEHKDRSPLVGKGHDRVGFYFYTANKVRDVKVYVKRQTRGLDIE